MGNTDWQTSLTAAGAVFSDGAVSSFGNLSAELSATASTNVLCDLSHLGLLQINGDDRATFLQGQVTNDVMLLAGKNAHYTGYCNPKGRMLALFLAFAHYDHIHLQLNHSLLEPILKRLKMYVMRSKVEIKDVSDQIVRFGFNGPEAASILALNFVSTPQNDYELTTLENAAILKLPSISNHNRYEIFSDAANADIIWNSLKANCQLVGKPCWDWLDIQAGIPDVLPATQEQFVPQMLNLDILNGISFKKGCYTGQEIVARTHYLGKVKRRTLFAHVSSTTEPQSGDEIKNAQQEVIGLIVRCAPSPVGGFDVLVELRLDQIYLTQLEAAQLYWQEDLLVFSEQNTVLFSVDSV